MRGKLHFYTVTKLIMVVFLPLSVIKGNAEPNELGEESQYLQAVREFADNVLKYGRDTYGPKHTPLFVDGVNIHTRNKNGGTPLHQAAGNGRIKIVELLLANQADINAKNKQGRTPLDLAGQNKHADIVKLLRSQKTEE